MRRHLPVFPPAHSAFARFVAQLPVALVSAALLLPLSGCQSQEADLTQISDSIEQSVSEVVDRAKGKVSDLRPKELAQDEFNKLHAFEYHVESVFLPTTASDLAIRLNELGKDKWDCGAPISGLTERAPILRSTPDPAAAERLPEFQALIICKRRPASYLRMLQRFGP